MISQEYMQQPEQKKKRYIEQDESLTRKSRW